MAGADAFQVEGVIIEVLANRTYRAELANGHQLSAFVAGKAKWTAPRLMVGQKVRLQLSPYDLSQGRILENTSAV
jgi:translation initiation factor IF-1